MREKLIALSMVKNGNWQEIYQFLRQDKNLDAIDESLAKKLIANLGEVKTVTILDDFYPESWREMSRPPFVLYLRGNTALLGENKLGLIGGKTLTGYTKRQLDFLIQQLPEETVVVTGFEQGVEAYGSTAKHEKIVCVATGFNHLDIYEKLPTFQQLTDSDLLISEIPPKGTFNMKAYYRNYHFINELSHVLAIYQMPTFDLRMKYLTYLTEMGKPVYVLPDRIDETTAGGLSLLNHGAKCLLKVGELVEEITDASHEVEGEQG